MAAMWGFFAMDTPSVITPTMAIAKAYRSILFLFRSPALGSLIDVATLLSERRSHVPDGSLAALFFRDFLVNRASGRGDLANEAKIASLELP
jgi:hypothetical protein